MSYEELIQIGFKNCALWERDGDFLTFRLLDHADEKLLEADNVLYAFTDECDVFYIGKTTRSIKNRFIGYRRPGKSQKTNMKCHLNIKERIAKGEETKILVFNPVADLQYASYPINLAAGLEDSFIDHLKPEWNGTWKSEKISETEQIELEEELEDGRKLEPPFSKEDLKHANTFEFQLRPTYYNKGFINPGVEASEHLGKHDDVLIVYLGNFENKISSSINRTANPSGSVRVVGKNSQIALWFQQNYKPEDVVHCSILDKQTIFVHTPSRS